MRVVLVFQLFCIEISNICKEKINTKNIYTEIISTNVLLLKTFYFLCISTNVRQMKTKSITKGKKVKYTIKGQIPLFDQYGNIVQHAGLVDVSAEHDVNWFKFWLADMAGILQVIGGAKMAVFSYIIENINRSTNEFGGTVREIAEKSNVAVSTVQETINLLLESDFMRRIRVATYQVNPDIMAYGNSQKRGYLVIRYSNLPEKTSIDEQIEEALNHRDSIVNNFEKEVSI